jgi:hypothetical protein
MSQGFTVGKGCLSVVFGLIAFIIIVPTLVVGGGCAGVVALLSLAPRTDQAPTPAPMPIQQSPSPDAEPTPAPTPEPISFQSGQQIITLEPVTLIGAQGSVTMPAGSRLTIESTTSDTATLQRGEFRATVPFSAIQPAE